MKSVSVFEFEKFWAEVLGEDFYVEEGLEDYDPKVGGPTVELDDGYLCYQGREEHPTRPKHVRRDEWHRNNIETGLLTLFERWQKAKTSATVIASFDVPHDEFDAFVERLRKMGAELLT